MNPTKAGDGSWPLEHTGVEGPNGEALVAEQHRCAADALTQLADIAQAWSDHAAKHSGDVAPGA